MQPDHMRTNGKYDVAILGTGIGGTIMGAALARNGARVLLLEQGSHPRFTIGESTIPETTIMFRVLAQRYGVPEIAYLSNYQGVRTFVSSGCGVKRNFSFAYHRPGEPHRGEETTQFPTWAPPFGPDVHFFRQDVDAFMLATAIRYGAVARQQVNVADISIDSTGVRLVSDKGEEFSARFVVDAGGMQAPVARKLKLRNDACPMKTNSRSIFTHMTGVRPYDEVSPSRREHGMPSPLAQGTLHHLFPGGWMWIIPFDNHPSSTSRLCSVGMNLELEGAAPRGDDPEAEFRELVARMPSVARQLEGARAVRNWTSTDRLQFNAARSAGERYALLPHATAFVDPLFSSGLSITVNIINALLWRILAALKDDDFSAERFDYVDEWTRRCFEQYYDRLVSCSYTSFRSFELWNAWHRVWMLGSLYGVSGLFEIHSKFSRTGDPSCFQAFEQKPYRGVQAVDFDEYAALFDAAVGRVEAVRAGALTEREAAGQILELLRESGLGPAPWNLTDPDNRCPGTFTLLPMINLVAWGRFRSPAAVRRHYFLTGRTGGLVSDIVKNSVDEFRRVGAAAGGVVRDAVLSWNADWKTNAPHTQPPAARD
ncbi:NAD(P)/FAD-dependent oxidoreductase [Sorangium sp. So ce1000]|uniref:NAD(P)/FAD-dependent oxidoreductase n=1 Tax=Sorangium sp. So ce1000 TaxID=3133325 RepID=UPI003F6269D2